ncbi:MAG TPA: isochorismatase family cysteine hydrolase [Acidobacteriota bacterium]|nr:isochorismatase family cysteine hydrolase [Acidobacteriota bacterium]
MSAYVTPETLNARTTAWLEEIAPFNEHNMRLDKDTCALLVIDMQRFFLDPESPTYTCGGAAILPGVKRLVAAFRAADRPVIFTRHVHHPARLDAGIMEWWWDGMCVEGSPESELHPDVEPLAHEKIILKHRYSAFYNTDLETVLRCLNIRDLVISGIMTNMCCESTARDAYYRDYRVFFLADGTGSVNEQMHLASLLNAGFGFAYVTTVARITAQMA